MSKKKKTIEKAEAALDKDLFSYIQPKGGITFKEPSYILTGEGYIRCLHVYTLPSALNDLWLVKIFDIPDTICTIDVSSKDINKVKKNINTSIGEENSRYAQAKNHAERYDAAKRVNELEQLYDELSRMGEVIKVCDFRIFVKDKTLEGLEEKCSEIANNIEAENYRIATLLSEQDTEWKSLFSPASQSHMQPFALKGLSLTSEQLAIGFPFNYSELIDEQGTHLGFTDTGGVVIFDEFTKTKTRQYYNAIVCGTMGAGKSTLLKKRFKHHAACGNYVRVFDPKGEFIPLTKEFGGKVIRCDGKEGMLNPFEIQRSEMDDSISFSKNITKIQNLYKCIVPSLDDLDIQMLSNMLREFYELYELTPKEGRQLTGLPATKYPTLSNFGSFLELKLNQVETRDLEAISDVATHLNVAEAKSIKTLLETSKNMISNYGYIFDGHTTINDITNEKIVTFDISAIKDLGNVFTAQMQNLVSLVWDNAVKNGVIMKEKWENGTKAEDITKFFVIIDEAHEWVNNRMPEVLDMILAYMREARKYFAGITLASQSVRDFMPEGEIACADKIKLLFELSQYAFMFKQSSSTIPLIQKMFGEELTYSQIQRIPYLEKGNCVFSILGERSLVFKVWLSMEYEEKLFSGGR